MSASTSDPFTPLRPHHYIQLTTFKQSGAGAPTPVWFAALDTRLYIVTPQHAARLKRIRNNERVTVAPCTYNRKPVGEALAGRAAILTASEQSRGHRALRQKYGWLYRIFVWFQSVRGIQSSSIEVRAFEQR